MVDRQIDKREDRRTDTSIDINFDGKTKLAFGFFFHVCRKKR